MPLDHYVPQVYLKNFYSPKLGNRMYAIRKSDLKLFTPNAQSVCRIKDANTNPYLIQDRRVEEFLKTIEPKYNDALEALVTQSVNLDCIYVIAGFISYILACSPAGIRLASAIPKGVMEETAGVLDSIGMLPKPPPKLAQ